MRGRVYDVASKHRWTLTLNFHPWTTNFDETLVGAAEKSFFEPTVFLLANSNVFCSFTGNGCLHLARSRCRGTWRSICPLARDSDGRLN